MAQPTVDLDGYDSVRFFADSSPVEQVARVGYLAKGLVYAIVGALVLLAAMGFARGDITGTRGALEALNNQAWGPIVLAFLAAGLLAFALWRAFQAIKDPDHKGNDASGLLRRAGLLISGGVYASLALYAGKLLLDLSRSGSGTDERAREVMAYDGGSLVLGLVAAGIIGVAFYQLYRVFNIRYNDQWNTAGLSQRQERTATLVAGFGITARAVAFLIVGGFLGWAAISGHPNKAQGMEGALNFVGQQVFGQVLVAIAGAGLFCYGLYCLINARYRHIDTGED